VNPSTRHSTLLILSICLVMCCTLLAPYASGQATSRETMLKDKNLGGPEAPIGEVSPTTWDFGPTLVGCTSPQKRISLTNTGDAQLTMDNISITGLFAIPVNRCGNGVKVGTHCDVYVTYSPEALQTDAGTLTFNDNASNSPQTVSLNGHGATTVPTETKMEKPNPRQIYVGQTTTLTANVVSLGGCAIPDGEVIHFQNKYRSFCDGLIQGGVATCQTSNFPVAHHVGIHAVYPGNAQYYASQSQPARVVDVLHWPTTTTLTSTPNPSKVGEPVTLTATVVASGPYPPTPGIVQFSPSDETWTKLGPGGIATTVYTFTTPGTFTINAEYEGNHQDGKSGASGTQVVNP
jgi:hypothetical protein